MRLILLPLLLVGLSGCLKQQAVRSGLTDAGVRGPVAECMSAEMAKRLSVAQLQKLANAQARPGEPEPTTIADYVARARRVGDTEVVAVTSVAAAYCSATR